MAVHLFGRPGRVGGAADRGAAGGRARRGRRRGARRELPRHAVRRARRRRLPLVPSAQDRDDGRGRRGHDRRGRRSTPRCAASVTTAGRRSATCPCPASTTASRTCSARSGSRSSARLEELLAARERVAGWYTERLEHHVLTPSAAEGDRHGWQAYVVQLDRRDEALAALRAAGIEAQIGTWALHRLEPYRGQGALPGRRPRVRARAGAPVRDDDDRGGGRTRRGGLDLVVSEC